jgi:RimJ/RimL family protein N-acetyltransferase
MPATGRIGYSVGTMPNTPTAPTPLLQLPGYFTRPMRAEDALAWTAFAVLPQVKRHTSSSVNSVADVAPILARAASDAPDAPVHFAVCTVAERRLVGTVGFHTISVPNRSAEITYMLHPGHWGRGLATDCARAAVAWGFGVRGWVRIQGTTLEPNVASQRVLLKAGFEYEGRLRNFRIVRGEPQDYLLFAVIAGSR